MVLAPFCRACRYLIRAAFVFSRAKRLEACILIVLPRITYAAIFFGGKVSANYLFGLVRVGFSVSILTFLGFVGLANSLATRLSELSGSF